MIYNGSNKKKRTDVIGLIERVCSCAANEDVVTSDPVQCKWGKVRNGTEWN
jgi:hypothetical protein